MPNSKTDTTSQHTAGPGLASAERPASNLVLLPAVFDLCHRHRSVGPGQRLHGRQPARQGSDLQHPRLTPGITSTAIASTALAFAERKRAFVILDALRRIPPPTAPPWACRRSYRRSMRYRRARTGALYFRLIFYPTIRCVGKCGRGRAQRLCRRHLCGHRQSSRRVEGAGRARDNADQYARRGAALGNMTNDQQGVLSTARST